MRDTFLMEVPAVSGRFGMQVEASEIEVPNRWPRNRRRRPAPGPGNAPRPQVHPGQYIRSVLRARDWSRAQGHERVAGRASRGDRLGAAEAVPTGPQAGGGPGAMGCRPSRCCAATLLKQYRQLSYQELAFHLSDSASFRAFARLPLHLVPEEVGPARDKDQRDTGCAGPSAGQRINRCLLASARGRDARTETGTLLRLDSTVTETMIHEPSDSWLLCDAMRIMVRLLDAAGDAAAGAGHCLA